MPPLLSVRGLTVQYPRRGHQLFSAVSGVNFDLEAEELVTMIGPSGCGKTTLLRAIAGLIHPSHGTLEWVSRGDSTTPQVAMVFQDYGRSLFPWYTVQQQLELASRHSNTAGLRRDELVRSTLALVRLREAASLLPARLSGGMQQRAALARALVMSPDLLLLDEPFGSVDALVRYELEDHLLRIWHHRRVTICMVTHDIDEAIYLSDRVLVLSPSPGRLCEIIDVNLPRPRSQSETRALPEFGALRRHAWKALNHD